MHTGARTHLAYLLARARGGPYWGPWLTWRVDSYHEFYSALGAFLAVDALTPSEAFDYNNRMLRVLGHAPVLPSSDTTLPPRIWLGKHRPISSMSANPELLFATDVAGSELQLPSGSRFWVDRIERFDDRTAVHWRQERSNEDHRLAVEMEAQERDLIGLPLSVRSDILKTAERYLRKSMYRFRLVDDIGTFYLPKSYSWAGSVNTTGTSVYTPQIPDDATRLFIEWYGSSVEIPMPFDSSSAL
jgi:hypothetical protein